MFVLSAYKKNCSDKEVYTFHLLYQISLNYDADTDVDMIFRNRICRKLLLLSLFMPKICDRISHTQVETFYNLQCDGLQLSKDLSL